MRGKSQLILVRYGGAVVFTALAVLLRWLLDPWLGDYLPFVTLFGAVAFAVWIGGYRPALLTVVLGFFACDYWFVEPRGQLLPVDTRNLIGLILSLLSCAIIIGFGEILRSSRRRLKDERAKVQESEAARQAAMQQLQIVTESMAVPVTRCSRDLKYQWVSKSLADWFGLPAEKFIGRPILDILGKEAFEQLRPHFEHVLTGTKVQFEEEINYPGLGRRWIRATYTPTFDAAGRVDGWVAVVLDLTEQRQMEKALAESEERFRQFAENINEVFWMTDLYTTKLLYISPAYERVWGRSCQSLYENPRSFMDAIHPEDRERVRIDVLERQSRGEQIDKVYRVVRPDGSIRWVQDRAFPVKDAAGRFYRLVGIIDDFTERKHAEEALKEADRRKDEFLATLAHELRNPLAPIRNSIELQRLADGDSDLIRQANRIMERQLGHMVRLVDDLLDISRITSGKLQLRKERTDLVAAIQTAIEAARPAIDAQAHELCVTLPTEPIYLDGDPIRLAQVFSNLLNNAAKYTVKGGHIWLTAERQENEAVVSVRDTGIGIAAEHLPNLFAMFSQMTPALERSQGGLGIGLALARGLVELHGGSIAAQSAGPGRGSEFTVRLPIVETPGQAQQEPSRDGEKSCPGAKYRILVADDLRDSVESLALMLRLLGHDIRTAHDGLEAVQAAATFRPDVAVLDIGMPKLNGYEAARHIRQQPWGKEMLLIALTGWGQEEDKQRALEAGFDHHLTKPVDAAALEKLLALINPA